MSRAFDFCRLQLGDFIVNQSQPQKKALARLPLQVLDAQRK